LSSIADVEYPLPQPDLEREEDDNFVPQQHAEQPEEDAGNMSIHNNPPTPKAPRKPPMRERNPPPCLKDYACAHVDHAFNVKVVPNSYNEAVAEGEESSKWKDAMQEEMNSLVENEAFEIVSLPENQSTIGGRWVYALKTDPSGNTIYKARYVAKGYSQERGLNYFDTFSPTAKITSVRTLMQIAAQQDLKVHQLDVKTAFLYAPIDCEIYMDQPKGFEQVGENGEKLVWRLRKSLYGLKQSGRNWNSLLHNLFEENQFQQSNADPCLYHKVGPKVFILVWVDDILVATKACDSMKSVKDLLKDKFKMKDLGPVSWFLGVQFSQSVNGIEMTQSHYLQGILKKFGMDQCRPRYTPCELKPSIDTPVNQDDVEEDNRKYREIVGSLVYAMTTTRPDLSWIVTKLSQHLVSPGHSDWTMLKHVLQYVKGTIDYKLNFQKSDDVLCLRGYSDADWGSSDDRKSTSGYYFSLSSNGPAISWKSKRQPTVALSSCEAEYMGLAMATQEAIFLRTLMKDFGLNSESPVQLQGDNQGSIALVKNPVHHNRSKHIDIKFHFVRDTYSKGIVDITYVGTESNVADLMTKAVSKAKLDKFQGMLFRL
jgi:hypothetical protein